MTQENTIRSIDELICNGFKNSAAQIFPPIINIEVYRGSCPCACVHCPVGLVEQKNRKHVFGVKGMEHAVFERIIDEIAVHPPATVRIHSVGEPLDWRHLPDALSYCVRKEVPSWIFTSAVTHDKHLLDSLCVHASIIEVSINSTDRDDYARTKGVDRFQNVTQNLSYLKQRIAETGSQTRLLVSRVQSIDPAADAAFVEHWTKSGIPDQAFVRSYHNYNLLLPQRDATTQESSGQAGCGTHAPQKPACLVHWGRCNISVDGYAVICFNELFKPHLHPDVILGDIRQTSIESIWNGQKMRSLRASQIGLDDGFYRLHAHTPCINCTSCQSLFEQKNQTSENQLFALKHRKEPQYKN